MEGRALRVFVAAWVALGLAGALDHTIAEKVLGHRVDLVLPELRYGYVMFNVNPRIVDVYEYAGADGARHPLADLVPTPAPGYARARVAVDAMLEPLYLREICYRATRSRHEEFDFFVDQYDVDADPRTPAHTTTLHCDLHGLAPR
ncbi:MAG TPA: hypothetical protein VGG39_11725 [Polyangiaceae bacterium]|jgi:hypothetical protein